MDTTLAEVPVEAQSIIFLTGKKKNRLLCTTQGILLF